MNHEHPTPEELAAILPFAKGWNRQLILIGLAGSDVLPQEWWHELAQGTASGTERNVAVSRINGRHPDDDRVLLHLLQDRSREVRLTAATDLSERGGPDIADAMFDWYQRTLKPPKRAGTADFHDVSNGVVYGLRTNTLERARLILDKARPRLATYETQAVLSWFPQGFDSPWTVVNVADTLKVVRAWRDQSTFSGGDWSKYVAEAYVRVNKRKLRTKSLPGS